jgi:hypothetical protein
MRTKTLLIAAATLVAGFISSEAQTVYSVNIAGYVTALPANGQFTLLANPLDNGTNNLTSLFPGIPGASTIQTWNGSGYDAYKFSAGHWKNLDPNNNTNADNFIIPPGVGFFISIGGSNPYTNTFVGNVVPQSSGASVTNIVQPGLQLIGSLIPFADAVTNTATVNLPVAGATTLQTWDPIAQQFVFFKFTAGSWKLNGSASTPQAPVITPAQGFFLAPPTVSNVWVQVSP